MNDTKDTLSDLIPQFLQDLESKGRSPSTILAYGSDLEQLREYLAPRSIFSVKQVTVPDLDGFRDYLLANKYTPKSTSRKLNAVKTFFRWLKDHAYLSTDLSKEVSHPKIEAPAPKYLSPIEYRALRDLAQRNDSRVAAMIELILQTGMRISEISNLKSADLRRDKVIVEAYATQQRREIPLNTSAREAVEDYIRERGETDSPFLFVSKNGKPLAVRNIRAMLDRYMQRAEITGYSVNDLRNTFIIENIKRGVDIVTISQAVGHKRISTTERYLQIAGVKEPGHIQELEEL